MAGSSAATTPAANQQPAPPPPPPQQQQQQPITSNSNYWNHSPPGTLRDSSGYYGQPNGATHNGHGYRYEDDTNGGFDSGNQTPHALCPYRID